MILTHGANSILKTTPYGLPFPDGEPLIYNGKTYKTKRIQNLLMQVEFFDEPVGSYNVHYGIKYYSSIDRFSIESLVSSMGWRLPLQSDIEFIKNEITSIKNATQASYVDLISNSSTRWDPDYRGENLTGLGMDPTGYDYAGSIYNQSIGWSVWAGSYSSQGNHATVFERYTTNNFAMSGNWNNGNQLPIIFMKDA